MATNPLLAAESSSMQPQDYYSRPRGPEQLSSHEIAWRDRQPFLESKGYMLRPRLRPGWTASWLATGESRFYCEDFPRLPVSQ